ncbi:MAG TPA: esterase [Burkholderiales bacterium]|nr:esterase [Burkholderiales bacterium]
MKLVQGSLLATVFALAGCASTHAPIALQDMGSFHVGGREVTISGKPVREVRFSPGGVPAKVDPNGVYQVEQMYVQYFIPADRKSALPLLLWHGGGLTGVTYETTPDGREGWLNYFIKQGWAVYNSDAVERGRSGWAMYPDVFKGEPIFLTKNDPFERFRMGQGPGSYNKDPKLMKVAPNGQFPVEAYDNFTKQGVPRWTTTDEAIIAAYSALVEKVCPCVVLVHSQAGLFGAVVAETHPDKVKGLVMVEPAAGGRDGARLKNTPVLAVYGDNIEKDARWPTIRANGYKYYDTVRAAGGKVDVINLPQAGVPGNSHMMMMDRNNLQVAGIIQKWLADQGLYR